MFEIDNLTIGEIRALAAFGPGILETAALARLWELGVAETVETVVSASTVAVQSPRRPKDRPEVIRVS